MLTEVTDANFNAEVLEADASQKVLVVFTAPWCGPCRGMKPVLEEFANEHGDDLKVFTYDLSANSVVAQAYSIRHMPTLMLYHAGQVVNQLMSSATKDQLEKFIA